MAWEIPGFAWTRVAGEDLSDSQYCAVDLSADSEAVLPTQGGRIIGVLRNKPGDGTDATIVSTGVVMGLIGITGVVAGDGVTVDDDGTFIQASSGDLVHGRAVETNAAGEIGTIFLNINNAQSGS